MWSPKSSKKGCNRIFKRDKEIIDELVHFEVDRKTVKTCGSLQMKAVMEEK